MVKRMLAWIVVYAIILSIPYFAAAFYEWYSDNPPALSEMPTDEEFTALLRHNGIVGNIEPITAKAVKVYYGLLFAVAISSGIDIFSLLKKKRNRKC